MIQAMHHLSTLVLLLLLCFTSFQESIAQDRNCDPLVISGVDISCMLGENPDDIVAFKYTATSGWAQIPVQIDERVSLDVSSPYDPAELAATRANGRECLWTSTRNVAWNVLFYADPKTHVGADTNPNFDADDELVLMVSDAGEMRTGNTYPAGTQSGSLCEIAIQEPLSSNAILGYIYVFTQSGGLDQAAGVDYVSYNFTYANNYLTNYKECVLDDPTANPENSVISTSNYELGFSRRWTEDVLKMKTGTDNTDLLDRHQLFINKGSCTSTEDRFSNSEGGHMCAIDGPIRAIRGVMGTASGPFTHLNILATACRVDYDVFFRLHPANGFNDVYDMNPNASGKLTYHRSGSSDAVGGNGGNIGGGATDWAYYDGNPGALVIAFDYETGLPNPTFTVSTYYDDDGTSPAHDCTGDGQAFGSSGFTLRTDKCTDPRYNNANNLPSAMECAANASFFNIYRTHYFLASGMTNSAANQYDQYAKNDLNVSITGDLLPVELLAFQAKAEKEAIVLGWTTASEIDNSHFEIERSEDAKTFKKIGEQKGQGTTLTQHHYEFSDVYALKNQTYYYRLKQVDTDGTYSYSNIQTARIEASVADLLVYPNPVGEEGIINLKIYGTAADATVLVTDLYGKVLIQLSPVLERNTWNTLAINVNDLPAGTYFIRTADGRAKTFVKQ